MLSTTHEIRHAWGKAYFLSHGAASSSRACIWFTYTRSFTIQEASRSAPLLDNNTTRHMLFCWNLGIIMDEPKQEHFDVAMKVLRYVKNSPGQGILLSSSSHPHLVAYCDVDWASCPRTRRSTTGYYICLGHSPVSWQSKKQSIVSHSSAEAEYRAMASTVSELTWLKSLLYDLGIYHSKPMTLFCDNQAALHIANNPVFHACTKHIEIDCHFVRERIQRKELLTAHVPSHCQPADLFTKALGKERLHFLLCKLGIKDLHAPT
ncbi:hypothetical protein SLEP1_g7329 [Rubroshorea leprosula]|uniref:Uncharacterized protein n=1 Tax=Rubroshorea leprosula TaxID=152421 RepID=A0AAV5I2M7_9ROSI|nr:hypothetical protein SLEP1_g7329 [Rubroshorea leprosula]